MNLVHENGSARPFAVPSLAPPRVRHGGNPCMQCAAKASSTEGARLSDGMRRNSSQIECFSVQVVRCSGTSVEESVHMHQAEYHAKKNSEKNVQSSKDCWSQTPRGRAHVTCKSFFRIKMSPAEHSIHPVTRFLELPSDAPVVRYTSPARPLSIREAPPDGLPMIWPCRACLVLRRWSAERPRTRGHPSGRAHPRPGARAG